LIATFVERNYSELLGIPIANAAASLPLGAARQYVKFQLDESGARLESEGRAAVVSLDDREPDRPRRFLFDRPFLLALQEPDSEAPYFLLWIANAELLIPADE
jgi:hypothetical protein